MKQVQRCPKDVSLQGIKGEVTPGDNARNVPQCVQVGNVVNCQVGKAASYSGRQILCVCPDTSERSWLAAKRWR